MTNYKGKSWLSREIMKSIPRDSCPDGDISVAYSRVVWWARKIDRIFDNWETDVETLNQMNSGMDIFNMAPHESYFDHIKDLKYQLECYKKDNDALQADNEKLRDRLETMTLWRKEAEHELAELRDDYIELLEKVKTHEE